MSRAAFRLAVAALLALALAAGCGEPAGPDPASLRLVPEGPVLGRVGAYGAHEWLGLPYAAPPVGERRWRAPAPPLAWEGTREALRFGAACSQFASPLGGDDSAEVGTPVGREDCLFLNVYAPAQPPESIPQGDERWPVMVWIHGGGNTIGTTRFYDGGRLAAEEGVVVVTVNYRLGAFGWFRHPALAEGAGAEERSGNFGTLDLIAALRWVQDRIAAFGGDPQRVTIFGESAGGTNVVSLLVSPLARGLFQRAIVQSGSTRSVDAATATNWADDPQPGDPHSAREAAASLWVDAGRAPDRAAARAALEALPPAELAAWLRARSAEAVLTAYRDGDRGQGMVDLPRLIRDGTVLPKAPFEERLAAGAVAPVPVVLGTNRDESRLFVFVDPEHVTRWFGIWPQVHDPERYFRIARIRSELWKVTGADAPAAALVRAGRGPVFAYRFDWDEEPSLLGADLGALLGAAHGFEIPFVFGHFNLGRQGRVLFTRGNRAGREALSAAMRSWWAAFARDGDPGRGLRGELPAWRPWNPAPGAPKFLVLDTPEGGGSRMSPHALTLDRVVAEIEQDPSLSTPALRCEALALVADWTPRFTPDDYAAHGCAEHPLVAGAR